MAKRLPAHLSYKSALTLLPPSEITPPIEATRRVHDKNFARWPPHINLLYPFLSTASESIVQGGETTFEVREEIRARIEEAIRLIQPFKVSLSADPPGTFHHNHRSTTVWLRPTTHHIQRLQAALQSEFSECNVDQRPFVPHLSVGQASSKQRATWLGDETKQSVADSLIEHREGSPIALDCIVDKVYVLRREGYKDRFRIIGCVPLLNQAH